MHIEDLIHRLASNGQYLFDDPINIMLMDNVVIHSLSSQIINGNSFTEKQANLAIKLVKKYQKSLSLALKIDLTESVTSPTFKFPLRTLNHSKSIVVCKHDTENKQVISVSFPFDEAVITKIKNYKRTMGIHGSTIGWNQEKKSWDFDLREDHIDWINCNIVDSMFSADNTFNDMVAQIENIKANIENYVPMVKFEDNAFVFKNVSPNVQQPIDTNLVNVLIDARKYGIHTWSDDIDIALQHIDVHPSIRKILADNKITNIQSSVENLTLKDLNEIIFNSLPLLVVIPGGNEQQHLEFCKKLFEKNGISTDNMSVLFRLDGERGKGCNTYIKDSKINNAISENTKIVFISGKIPKPMIESKINFSAILNFGISGVHYMLSNYIKNHHFVINFNLREADIAEL